MIITIQQLVLSPSRLIARLARLVDFETGLFKHDVEPLFVVFFFCGAGDGRGDGDERGVDFGGGAWGCGCRADDRGEGRGGDVVVVVRVDGVGGGAVLVMMRRHFLWRIVLSSADRLREKKFAGRSRLCGDKNFE